MLNKLVSVDKNFSWVFGGSGLSFFFIIDLYDFGQRIFLFVNEEVELCDFKDINFLWFILF